MDLQGNMQQEEDTQSGKYLTFCLGEEVFGIAISYVTEIVGMQPVTHMPEVPPYIRGIINLRGRIVPVMDMRTRFGLAEKEYTERTCIIVIDVNEAAAGLIVDGVAEVAVIGEENIEPLPGATTAGSRRYISGIGKNGEAVTLLLDCTKLFEENTDLKEKAS